MEYILILFLIVLSFKFRKSKILTTILFTLLIIIMGLNNHHEKPLVNMDFHNYNLWFLVNNSQNITGFSNEPLFRNLIVFFWKMGYKIIHLRIFIAFLGYFLIFKSISKLTVNVNPVISLYLIFPLINDVIQIRNFLSYSIVVYAITLYLINQNKLRGVYSILLIVIAGLIHQANYVYILFIPLLSLKISTLKKISISIFLIGIVSIYSGVMQDVLNTIIDNDKILGYFSRLTYEGAILILGSLFLMFITFYLPYNELRIKTLRENDVIKLKFFNNILRLNLISVAIGFLWLLDFNYIRLYRNILLFNYIIFVYYLYDVGYSKNKVLTVLLVVFHMIYFAFIFYFVNVELYIIPSISDNYLIDFIRYKILRLQNYDPIKIKLFI